MNCVVNNSDGHNLNSEETNIFAFFRGPQASRDPEEKLALRVIR